MFIVPSFIQNKVKAWIRRIKMTGRSAFSSLRM